MNPKVKCRHCGTPFRGAEGGFCCAGCERVFHLIQDSGLEDFYSKQDRVGQPLESMPFVEADTTWAETLRLAAEATVANGAASARLNIGGMTCAGCVWLVERLARREPGLRAVRCRLESGELELSWKPGVFDLTNYVSTLQRFGYTAAPGAGRRSSALSPLSWRVLLCGVFTLNGVLLALPDLFGMEGFVFERLFDLFAALFAILSVFVGAGFIFKSAGRTLGQGRLDFDVFAAGVLVLAWGLLAGTVFPAGEWTSGCALVSGVVLFLCGLRWLRFRGGRI